MAILRSFGTPLLIHQASFSMINRWLAADRLLDDGIPKDSRMAEGSSMPE